MPARQYHSNDLGQPVGEQLPGWTARPRPPRTAMEGRFARLEILDPQAHGAALYDAFAEDVEGRCWTYLPYGPFADFESYRDWLESVAASEDPLFHTIIDKASGRPVGVASYLRIDPPAGVIEVGHINMAPALQRTATATDAMYLMASRAFDELGYRRYEWKCDAANARSMRAAERLGFTAEGIFRQATIYRGRNRDTGWFSIVDKEWPAVKQAFERWLAPENFDADGRQEKSLESLAG